MIIKGDQIVDLSTTPIIKDGDQIYLSYDEIQITQSGIEILIAYKWRGKTAYTLKMYCILSDGETLTLSGCSGRLAAELL